MKLVGECRRPQGGGYPGEPESIRANLPVHPRRLLRLFVDRRTDQGTRRPSKNERQLRWFESHSLPFNRWRVLDPAAGPGLYAMALSTVGTWQYLGIERVSRFVSYSGRLPLPDTYRLVCGEFPGSLPLVPADFNVALLTYEILNSLSDRCRSDWLQVLRDLLGNGAFLLGDFRAPSQGGFARCERSVLYAAVAGSVFADGRHWILDTLTYDEQRAYSGHNIRVLEWEGDRVSACYSTRLELIPEDSFLRLCRLHGFEPLALEALFPSVDAGFTLPSRSLSFVCQIT